MILHKSSVAMLLRRVFYITGDIEQDMDVGLLLYRDDYYNSNTQDKGIIEINVAKNRNGATGTCKVLFSPSVGAFSNIVDS